MCLYKYRKTIFKRNITCYKVLLINKINDEIQYVSPYQNEPYMIEQIKSIDKNEPEFYTQHIDNREYNLIRGDGLYSYKNLKDAIAECNQKLYSVVVKCIIPKSSKFVYKGHIFYSPYTPAFVSQQLKPIEIVHVKLPMNIPIQFC